MQVEVNNQAQTISEEASLKQLMTTLGYEQPRGVAVAVNDTVVPKSQWETQQLRANDRIMIITATQGG